METCCRVLAGILAWCAWVGFAGYVLWAFLTPRQARALLAGLITDIGVGSGSPAYVERHVETYVGIDLATWLTWFYSPLNIFHWAVAVLLFAPALGVYMLARHLAWRRQR